MRKKLQYLWIIAALILISSPGNLKAKTTEASYPKNRKKIISIVYDDSASMVDGNDSWAQANYAMQVLASLLNEDDQMYITYMSRCYSMIDVTETVDLEHAEQAVKKIHDTPQDFSGTPLESVVVAKEKLDEVRESDENAQYWLLILTDGDMAGTTEYPDLQDALDDYKGSIMSNHSGLNIMYLGIGDYAKDIAGDESQQLYTEKCGKDIVPSLRDIANRISGRMKFEDDDIEPIDAKTVKVHTALPLYSISILSQKSKAGVKTVKGEKSLTVERNIPLKYPPEQAGVIFSSKDTTKNLYGNAALITDGSKLIQPGDYTITFSEKVKPDDILIMYQPAIEMDVKITRQGKTVKKQAIAEGDLVDVEIIPINPETGKEIPAGDLPDDIKWKIRYEVDGKEIDSAKGRKIKNITIAQGKNQFICSMQVGNYFPQVRTITFSPDMNLDIETDPSDSPAFPRRNMGAGTGKPYLFYVTGNGKRLSKKELPRRGRLRIKSYEHVPGSARGSWFITGGLLDAKPGLRLNDDGSFALYPKNAGLLCYLVRSGEYRVTVELSDGSGISGEGIYIVEGAYKDWTLAIFLLLLLFLLVYTIYIIFVKPKFNEQELLINYYTSDGKSGGICETQMCRKEPLHKFHGPSVLLPGPSAKTLCGITFIAESGEGIYIKGTNVKKGFDKYGYLAGKPEKRFARMVKAMTSVKEEEGFPEKFPISTEPLYLYKLGILYQIYIK